MPNKKFKVAYKDVYASRNKLAFFDMWRKPQNQRWYVTIAVELLDEAGKPIFEEKFFLLACSKLYAKRPLRSGIVSHEPYTIVQKTLHMKPLRKIARERVESIKAKDAADFESQMSKLFLTSDKPL